MKCKPFFVSIWLGVEVAVEVLPGLAAERFQGDIPDAGGLFGDERELSRFGAMRIAAGMLPGGIGFEEEAVCWNLAQGFVKSAGWRMAAEGSAEGEIRTEFDPGPEVLGASAPGVQQEGGRGEGADGGEEVVPNVAHGVEGAGALQLMGELELSVENRLLRGEGGVGELAVESNFTDSGAGEVVKQRAERVFPIVGPVGKPGMQAEMRLNGGVFREPGDLRPVGGLSAVDEEGVDMGGRGAEADGGEGALGYEFVQVAVGIGPTGWGGVHGFISARCAAVVNLPLCPIPVKSGK